MSTHAYVPLLCLMATFPSACSFDAGKLRAQPARTLDGAVDYSADSDAVQAGTGGTMEVGQVDSGATDQAPPPAGSDAALGQDCQDGSGANPADAVQAGTGGAMEVGRVDSGVMDQAPPTAGSDAASGQDGQDSSGANPDTALDGASDHSTDPDAVQAGTGGAREVGQVDSGVTDQAPPTVGSDAALGQDGQDSSGTNPDTNTGTGIVADGTYRVIARHSGEVLEVHFSLTADGSKVEQWPYNGGKNQLWTLTHLGGNVYEILGVQSGKALEVATTSTADHTNVDIRTYTGAANQKWTIGALSGGYFRLTPVSSSGSALDVAGDSMTDGASVVQYTWLGGDNYNQQWTFQAP